MVRRDDYITFKVLAAHEKMTHVDFEHKLLTVYLGCIKENHEAIIADLLKKKEALVEALTIYQKRFGKIYNTPADKTHIGSNVDVK